jgi:hypothetical protein
MLKLRHRGPPPESIRGGLEIEIVIREGFYDRTPPDPTAGSKRDDGRKYSDSGTPCDRQLNSSVRRDNQRMKRIVMG